MNLSRFCSNGTDEPEPRIMSTCCSRTSSHSTHKEYIYQYIRRYEHMLLNSSQLSTCCSNSLISPVIWFKNNGEGCVPMVTAFSTMDQPTLRFELTTEATQPQGENMKGPPALRRPFHAILVLLGYLSRIIRLVSENVPTVIR